jgi:hypothetical protein
MGKLRAIDSERQETGERRFAEAVMKKAPRDKIESGSWEFYSVRNDRRGLYELHPKPMSIKQLIAAAANSFRRELPHLSVSNSRLEQRRTTARMLFNLATSKSWMSVTAATISWNKDLALELIERANAGDPDADSVLRDAAGVFITRGLLLPLELGDYVVTAVLTESKKKGAPPIKGKFHLRDRYMAYTVQQVMRHGSDLEATRGKPTRELGGKESACSVVATAFGLAGGKGLDEASINGIWGHYQREYPVRLPVPSILK